MSIFDDALEYVLANEGGFQDGSNDLGGATNKGISLNFLKSLPGYENSDVESLKHLTDDQIKKIYFDNFWHPIYQNIQNAPMVIYYIFDMAVNMGPANAHKTVQRALWACSDNYRNVLDDGVMGPSTIHAINDLLSEYDGIHFIQIALRAQRCGYYYMKIVEHPLQKDKLEGWLNRTFK